MQISQSSQSPLRRAYPNCLFSQLCGEVRCSWCTEPALAVDLSAELGRRTWAELEVVLISMVKTFQCEKKPKRNSGTRRWVLQERTTLRMAGVQRSWKVFCTGSFLYADQVGLWGQYVLQLFSELQASTPRAEINFQNAQFTSASGSERALKQYFK